ncbi:hypothetical protein GYMLUDRAFT_381860 [Collybiopsis luxurians FD-317 M1]|nr:hypothetical protein GYMLUDRAFT_381860 [Collybiopsis luxurians FD-317 M1]
MVYHFRSSAGCLHHMLFINHTVSTGIFQLLFILCSPFFHCHTDHDIYSYIASLDFFLFSEFGLVCILIPPSSHLIPSTYLSFLFALQCFFSFRCFLYFGFR